MIGAIVATIGGSIMVMLVFVMLIFAFDFIATTLWRRIWKKD